jgi:hypothetical protein
MGVLSDRQHCLDESTGDWEPKNFRPCGAHNIYLYLCRKKLQKCLHFRHYLCIVGALCARGLTYLHSSKMPTICTMVIPTKQQSINYSLTLRLSWFFEEKILYIVQYSIAKRRFQTVLSPVCKMVVKTHLYWTSVSFTFLFWQNWQQTCCLNIYICITFQKTLNLVFVDFQKIFTSYQT